MILALCLAAGVTLAYLFPIYIRHNTKICLISIPLFIMAAALPVPLGSIAALLSLLLGEILTRSARGSHARDIAANVGRWVVLIVAASYAAHVSIASSVMAVRELPLLAAAIVLWLGDLITLPIALSPATGERPAAIIRATLREGGIAEAAQYGMGILGVLLLNQEVWALLMLVVPAALVYMAFRKEIDPDTFQLLEMMADNVDLRDPYTRGHSRRVAILVENLLAEVGMQGQEARQIVAAARLHDIGKVEVPDHVLIKSGALSGEEQALLEGYPDRGVDLLSDYSDFSRGAEMVRHHHEHWDGSGYPDGLKGTDIPFGARIIAVADSYDAMTSERPYRRALTPERAASILLHGRGRQWDPDIVDAFLRSVEKPEAEHSSPAHMESAATPSVESPSRELISA